MIELAAAVWKLEIADTLQRLAAQGLSLPEDACTDASIQRHVRDHVTLRRRVNTFWDECRRRYPQSSVVELRDLQRKFNGSTNFADGWFDRGGRLVGASHVRDAEARLTPSQQPPAGVSPLTLGMTARGSAVFKGGKWSWAIVIPYYDVPGRICGFVFAGREGNVEKGDWVYLPLRRYPDKKVASEAGAAWLETTLLPPHPILGTTVFAFTRPDLALLLQLRNAKDSSRLLPLTATWDDQLRVTTDVWQGLTPERTVCWGNGVNTAVLKQAKRANASIATLTVAPGEIEQNTAHRSPVEWLNRIAGTAKPWRTVLRNHLATLPAAEVESLLRSLDLVGPARTEFLLSCDPATQERLSDLEAAPAQGKQVRYGGHTVHERDGAWYLSNDEMVCDAVIRIESVLTSRNNRSYYRGAIIFRGESYPFVEKTATLERGLLTWAQAHLRDIARAGVMNYHPSWNRKAFGVAVAFCEPAVTHGVDAIGWDQAQLRFNFPKFCITGGGEVQTDTECLFDDDTVPCRHMLPPEPLPRRHVEALGEPHDECRVFWAVAACIINNVIAPATNRQPTGIILDGDGAQGVGVAAAIKLGCTTLLATRNRANPIQMVLGHRGPHHWPVLIANGDRSLRAGPWLTEPEFANTIHSMSWYTARVLGIRGRWNLVSCDRKLGSLQLLADAAAGVLPTYIQDLFRRRLWFTEPHADHVLNVLADMASWFTSCGGNGDTVASAAQLLQLPGTTSPAKYFSQLAFRLYTDRSLGFVHETHDAAERKHPAIVFMDREQPSIWIPQNGFSDQVRDHGGLPPDMLLITRSLQAEKVLLDEVQYRGERGWLVAEDWWNKQLSE